MDEHTKSGSVPAILFQGRFELLAGPKPDLETNAVSGESFAALQIITGSEEQIAEKMKSPDFWKKDDGPVQVFRCHINNGKTLEENIRQVWSECREFLVRESLRR